MVNYDRKNIGTVAELTVAQDLQSKGLQLLAHQYAVPRLGELDLVFSRQNRLFIVEVKARSDLNSFGGGFGAITPEKQRKIRKTALYFAQSKGFMNMTMQLLAAEVHLVNGVPQLPIRYLSIE